MRKEIGSSHVEAINASPELFDGQAGFFEQRAGLPVDCCREVAKRVVEVGEAGAGDLIVEVGSGTGQIGQWFEASVRYVGFDLSAGMLKEFRRHLGVGSSHRMLVQADANGSWPLLDGAARVIFSSRAMHLLDHERVAPEVFRIASPAGATLILGRVERTHDSIRNRMAQEMNERLLRRGFEGRRGERRNRKLIEACVRRGAEILEPVAVATWSVSASPRQSLDSWRRLTGLGGIPVPATVRAEVLRELEVWAEEEFGGLDREFESEETYVLKSLRVPPTHAA
ncbi:MAG: class I SAM-dependent methyltransferase [Pyrinomonadaceae bacterium]